LFWLQNKNYPQNVAICFRFEIVDWVLVLITNKLLPKKVFIDTYWYTILRCWLALETEIKKERHTRGHPGYMKNFEDLYNRADRHRYKKHPTVHPNFNEICKEKDKKNNLY
jgi:hypothetical protein